MVPEIEKEEEKEEGKRRLMLAHSFRCFSHGPSLGPIDLNLSWQPTWQEPVTREACLVVGYKRGRPMS